MTGLREGILAALALPLLACSPQAAEQVPAPTGSASVQEERSAAGLEIISVTVTTDTDSHVFRTEVAATREQQSRGMMFRTQMAPDEAMIFPYETPDMLGFWMKNTVLPLDIIFIDDDGMIINIGEGIPYNEESVTSERPAIAVLELAGGRSKELGIEPGDRVEW